MGAMDIHGLASVAAVLATIALGLSGLLAAGLAALAMPVPEGDLRSLRLRRWLAGPFACLTLGAGAACAVFGVVGVAERLDGVALLLPLSGVGLWVGLTVAARRRRAQRLRLTGP